MSSVNQLTCPIWDIKASKSKPFDSSLASFIAAIDAQNFVNEIQVNENQHKGNYVLEKSQRASLKKLLWSVSKKHYYVTFVNKFRFKCLFTDTLLP